MWQNQELRRIFNSHVLVVLVNEGNAVSEKCHLLLLEKADSIWNVNGKKIKYAKVKMVLLF